jgi:hypothetical protein
MVNILIGLAVLTGCIVFVVLGWVFAKVVLALAMLGVLLGLCWMIGDLIRMHR